MKPSRLSMRSKGILFFLCFALVSGAWFLNPATWGSARARIDLVVGKPVLKIHGLPAPCTFIYLDILEKKFGIHSEIVAGCVSTQRSNDYWRGYNDTVSAHFIRKHGRDIFEESWKMAEEELPKFQKSLESAT